MLPSTYTYYTTWKKINDENFRLIELSKTHVKRSMIASEGHDKKN